MHLESARELKDDLIEHIVNPLSGSPGVRRGGARVAALRVDEVRASSASSDVGAKPLAAVPRVPRFLALGIAPCGHTYRIAVRLQRQASLGRELVEHIVKRARREVDIRMIFRIDKCTRRTRSEPPGGGKRARRPWFRANNRPLSIGGSVGHFNVTAGTLARSSSVRARTSSCRTIMSSRTRTARRPATRSSARAG